MPVIFSLPNPSVTLIDKTSKRTVSITDLTNNPTVSIIDLTTAPLVEFLILTVTDGQLITVDGEPFFTSDSEAFIVTI